METPKRTQARILRKAAKVVEKYGWAQGTIGDLSQGYSALGAVYQAALEGYRDSTQSLCRFLKEFSIPSWNDDRGRTAQEVIKAMRGCASWLEHGGGN